MKMITPEKTHVCGLTRGSESSVTSDDPPFSSEDGYLCDVILAVVIEGNMSQLFIVVL